MIHVLRGNFLPLWWRTTDARMDSNITSRWTALSNRWAIAYLSALRT